MSELHERAFPGQSLPVAVSPLAAMLVANETKALAQAENQAAQRDVWEQHCAERLPTWRAMLEETMSLLEVEPPRTIETQKDETTQTAEVTWKFEKAVYVNDTLVPFSVTVNADSDPKAPDASELYTAAKLLRDRQPGRDYPASLLGVPAERAGLRQRQYDWPALRRALVGQLLTVQNVRNIHTAVVASPADGISQPVAQDHLYISKVSLFRQPSELLPDKVKYACQRARDSHVDPGDPDAFRAFLYDTPFYEGLKDFKAAQQLYAILTEFGLGATL